MDLKVIKPFDWAHRGVQVESFQKDQIITTEDPDLIRVSLAEKWTKKQGKGEAPGPDAGQSAPEASDQHAVSAQQSIDAAASQDATSGEG